MKGVRFRGVGGSEASRVKDSRLMLLCLHEMGMCG